jgi:hypothetical protein
LSRGAKGKKRVSLPTEGYILKQTMMAGTVWTHNAEQNRDEKNQESSELETMANSIYKGSVHVKLKTIECVGGMFIMI